MRILAIEESKYFTPRNYKRYKYIMYSNVLDLGKSDRMDSYIIEVLKTINCRLLDLQYDSGITKVQLKLANNIIKLIDKRLII